MALKFRVSLPDAEYWTWRVPCQMGCPVRTDCGGYVQMIAEQRLDDGYRAARSPNPMASSCARICAAPCEDQCRRGHFDAPVSIRALKRVLTSRYGIESNAPTGLPEIAGSLDPETCRWRGHLQKLPHEVSRSDRKVAVVGAGPAGLACAHDLAWMGYRVTIFEASARAGGMAFHGIPEFRLQRDVLDAEIESIRALGVDIVYNHPLTPEQGLSKLREAGFDAVFLAVGTRKGRDLRCPGSDLDGVVRAIDYIINVNNGYRIPSASKVLVLGGGFVAFDAARMALRAMAESPGAGQEAGGGMSPALDAARIAVRGGANVTLACLESLQEMPATRSEQGREELHHALEEGIQLLPQRGIKSIEGDGHVQRVKLVGVKRTYDEAGRFAPVYDESVEEEREADLVILAIGQAPDLDFLLPDDAVELTRAGTIRIDPETLATSAPGVYAGGDVAFGPRNLIDAVADGKRAARAIHAFLAPGAQSAPAFHFNFEKIPTSRYQRKNGYELLSRQPPPTSDTGRRTGITEVELAYDSADAERQADRCLHCHVQTIYDPDRCVLCCRCVDICPENALRLVPLDSIDLPEDQIATIRERSSEDRTGVASAMLKDDEVCIRCGLCAIRCPTDAMTMERLSYEERTESAEP